MDIRILPDEMEVLRRRLRVELLRDLAAVMHAFAGLPSTSPMLVVSASYQLERLLFERSLRVDEGREP